MHEYIFGLIPTDDVAERAIAASRVLRKRGGLFGLDTGQERPHVTLYYCVLPRGVLAAAKQRIARCAARTRPFDCVATGISTGEWVNVRYHRSRAILSLHREVIRAINPLRRGALRARDRDRLATGTSRERGNIARYGYRLVGSLYRPHLTFTRLRDPRVRIAVPEGARTFTFRADAIGLFAAGAYGTCVRLLKQFPLYG